MHSLLLSYLYAEPDGKQGKEEKPEPEANFALSGKLAAESNTVKGVVLVHQEPPEARKPSQMWRLYGFKNGEPSSSSSPPSSFSSFSSSSSSSSPFFFFFIILSIIFFFLSFLLNFFFFFCLLFFFSIFFSLFFFLFCLLSVFFFFLVPCCALPSIWQPLAFQVSPISRASGKLAKSQVST